MLKKLPVMVVVLIALTLFRGQAKAVELRTVWITCDGTTSVHLTSKTTVGEFLEEQGITLYEKDKINIELTEKLYEGWPIEIERAFDLEIHLDNKPEIVRIAPGTKVGNLVAEIGRETGNEYNHDYSFSDPITPESVLKFYSTTQASVTETEQIDFETEIIQSDELYEGEVEILSEGEYGLKEITYMVVLKFDVETNRVVTNTEIIKEPVKRIEMYGTRKPKDDLYAPPTNYRQMMTMLATGYSAHYESTGKSPGHPHYGITASGMPVAHGVVAVDPNVIPLGTKLFVEGYGQAIAADTGSAIKGYKIDLYFESLQDARGYGQRSLNVYVIE